MLYYNKSQSIDCNIDQFIEAFCEEIAALNFTDADHCFTLFALDIACDGCGDDDQWQPLKIASQKILDAGKLKPNAIGFRTLDFSTILHRLAQHGRNKSNVRLSENSGIHLQVNKPETSESTPDKKSNRTNTESSPKSLVSSVVQPISADASYLPIYTPVNTPISHTNTPTTNTKNSNGKKGTRGSAANTLPMPIGAGSIIDMATVRTNCALDRTGKLDRSAPAGISRPDEYQERVVKLADPLDVPRYRDLTDDQKFACDSILAANNNALFFRTSFSDKLAAMFSNPEFDAARYVADQLNRALTRRFGQSVAFTFKFEYSRDKKSVKPMHLHGFMFINRDSLTEKQATELKRLMCGIGGVPLASDGAHIRNIYDGLGVYGYLKKAEHRTSLFLTSGDPEKAEKVSLTGANQLMGQFRTKMHAEHRYFNKTNDNAKPALAA